VSEKFRLRFIAALCNQKLAKSIGDFNPGFKFYKFNMKYVAAYILLSLGGKSSVSEQDLTNYLKSINSEVNAEQVKAVVAALQGQSLAELSTKGLSKISAMSFGSGPAPASTTGAAQAKPKEAPKEEPKVEEEAVDMDLGDMFG
jgi:large subunit ribosomal protein LP2